MLNCGATSKLEDLLSTPLPESVSVYILDVHLPAYHTSVRSKEQILVFGWAPMDNAAVPLPGDSDLEDEDEEEEEEEEQEEGAGAAEEVRADEGVMRNCNSHNLFGKLIRIPAAMGQ